MSIIRKTLRSELCLSEYEDGNPIAHFVGGFGLRSFHFTLRDKEDKITIAYSFDDLYLDCSIPLCVNTKIEKWDPNCPYAGETPPQMRCKAQIGE
ncbi:hypothetical protein MPH61_17300 [Peribacillus muralis]|uniref:hypothetical protein n=1 Tax=Peribacillus muralis TaxID=264697 RepID=UPI001F4E87CC|nr:hypothetical protein [Peribacillus muralis]MCK1994312.1 hypothetical protein [Peribacillus muralis]MCK2014903.1 hypothetical protein [Peribacillus muralis]